MGLIVLPPPQGIDAHEIIPGVWQGAEPPAGWALSEAGFEILVLAAREAQWSADEFPGLIVYRVPLDDEVRPFSATELQRIEEIVEQVAMHAAVGRKTLISCVMGINRSGFITARVIQKLTGSSAGQAIAQVKRRRKPVALTNPAFVRTLLTGGEHA